MMDAYAISREWDEKLFLSQWFSIATGGLLDTLADYFLGTLGTEWHQ